MNKLSLQEAYNVLQKHQNWIVVGHYGADGDCIGSIMSLCGILKNAGKNVIAYHPEPILGSKDRFSALPLSWISQHLNPSDLIGDWKICAVDCADMSRVSPKGIRKLPFSGVLANLETIEVQIDHHVTNTFFAENNLVQQASSTVEIIHDLLEVFKNHGWQTDEETNAGIANSMWVGLVTDTGSFGYSSAGANSHLVAASLLTQGVDPGFWRAQLFGRNSLASLKVEAKMMDRSLSLLNNRLLIGVINHDMLKSAGLKPEQGQDGADKLRDIDGIQIGVSIRFLGFNKPWKVSSRTNNPNIDLSKLALCYGGGGHPGAAGWMWKDRPKALVEDLQIQCNNLYPECFKA